MWAYRDAEPGQVVFVYTSDKRHEARRGPKELLEAIREMRAADRLARENKERRQRAPKRA